MREILFRGFRKCEYDDMVITVNGNQVRGSWAYGDVNHHWDNQPRCISDFCGSNPVIPETVGQFIGLVDKNGKKIFEGDIVKNIAGFKTVVTFSNGAYLPFTNSEITLFYVDECEVIGNVYENSELIKVSE